MIKKSIGLLFLLVLVGSFIFKTTSYTAETPVVQIQLENGGEKPLHYIQELDEVQRKIGEELFLKGSSIINGKKTSRISKHYVCSSCHNNVLEDQKLTISSAEQRLSFAREKGLPVLQGTTLYGTVNKTTWYNGDYEKKYGSLVTSARDTLQNAIQLCAKVCSQGRTLSAEELEAFMHYFWSLQLKVGDLNVSIEENQLLNSGDQAVVLQFINSKFLDHAPATFVEAIPKQERKKGEGANIENGKVIYEQGCMHCHSAKAGNTNLKLGDDLLSYKYLAKATMGNSHQSIYRIVREGTYPIEGYKPYMPHYTNERLSNQQVEDLVGFVLSKAKNNE